MNYSLEKNAISSLNIAIEHFKRFFYRGDNLSNSEFDESIKISVIFLENAIELFLKALLYKNDKASIFTEKGKEKLNQIYGNNKENIGLEEFLAKHGNINTISYSEAVNNFCKQYKKPNRTKKILINLANLRNRLTHFGIEIVENDYVMVYSALINTFDVIYNDLYEELCELNEVGYLFEEESFLGVETVHGYKPLITNDGVYNNIIDFIDELLDEAPSYICYLQYTLNKNGMREFIRILTEFISNNSTVNIENNNYNIEYNISTSFNSLDIMIDIYNEEFNEEIQVISQYSIYYDKLYFTDECGMIYFCFDNKSGKIIIYNDITFYESPETYNQIERDFKNQLCEMYKLNTKAIEEAIINTVNLNRKEK